MDYYIATGLDNMPAHNDLRDKLNALGHHITYDWTEHGPAFQHGLKHLSRVASLEVTGVADAELFVLLWKGGRGTHVELGIAIAHGALVAIITDVEDHHQSTRDTCAFYHYPGNHLFHTVDEFLSWLKKNRL